MKKSSSDKSLTLVGHLEELRRRILIVAISFLATSIICYTFAEKIIRNMVSISDNIEFVFISPAELVLATFRIALLGGLVLSGPLLITQIWLFVSPGLNSKEQRYVAISILLGGVFFALGVVFSYFIVIPTMLIFFMGFQLDIIQPMISFSSYLSFILSIVFAFGIIFELPILMILLTRFGIVKVSFIKKNRKYIILIIFVVAAVITPPDVVSQLLLAMPMILLTEVGIFLSSMFSKKE